MITHIEFSNGSFPLAMVKVGQAVSITPEAQAGYYLAAASGIGHILRFRSAPDSQTNLFLEVQFAGDENPRVMSPSDLYFHF